MNLNFKELQPYASEEQFFGVLMALLGDVLWESDLGGRGAEVDLQG